jgi:ureidoacrylate peracid hydrolase
MQLIELKPEETALIVIDPQNGAYHEDGTLAQSGVDITEPRATIPRIKRLVELCRAAGIPDVWTRQLHYAEDRARMAHRIQHHTLKRKRLAFQAGTWDSEFVDELKPLVTAETQVIDKHKWSAFYGTRLSPLLRILGARLLLVCGGTTNACVESTVRDAFMRDFDVMVVGDCVAGVNPKWHEAALETWAMYIGEVVDLAEVEEQLSAREQAA